MRKRWDPGWNKVNIKDLMCTCPDFRVHRSQFKADDHRRKCVHILTAIDAMDKIYHNGKEYEEVEN